MEQKQISDLVPGDVVLGYFVIRKKELKDKKSTNETYLSFELGDRSGRIRGSLWNDIETANKSLHVGDIVKVRGKVITFLDQNHLSIEQIRKATDRDLVRPEQFLPISPRSIPEMYDKLKSTLKAVNHPELRRLIDLFLTDPDFEYRFCHSPGGKLWHHTYIGGLLEHTLSVVQVCRFFVDYYGNLVDGDLLLTAAFLHDVGKIEEFSLRGFVDYSTPGRLLGHIVLGSNMVIRKIEQIQDFPASLQQRLVHCILSHHGEKERGSPVVPMTIEALILNFIDNLDSSVAAFQRIMAKEKEPGRAWSNYVNLIDRFIYFGEDEK
ncbi:MAG: HD domain-containing protein [candidate division KSB1 bacterium]|nr:HD domain-containing protein [candidate division KSB1 bacterium]MDZ7333683.1 HD domain-containing protein [candidate division KSB1 bacterium]MDZ7356131.1 HD domain-containing protein [candidate division KSB1 bacterium]MDZ7375956.1 HD domain-containing protein [candidate division KSB1 bacterium]MDZ7398891.1 HD domain-containing protein [candidate division KSB1 bacterium]